MFEPWKIGLYLNILVAIYALYMAVKATPSDMYSVFQDTGHVQKANLVGYWIAITLTSAFAIFAWSNYFAKTIYIIEAATALVGISADLGFTNPITRTHIVILPVILFSLFSTMWTQTEIPSEPARPTAEIRQIIQEYKDAPEADYDE
jgi:hypothetical protein